MNNFLRSRPQFQNEAVAAIEAAGLEDVVHWSSFTRGRARRLVVSYCFPPTADSSAVVAARRVVEHGECVDVVSHGMGRLRGKDGSVKRLTRPYVARQWVLNGPTATLSWAGGVRDFVEKGWARVQAENPDEWPYASVYSRAMWPASHLLAAHVVLQRPGTRWTAEMSDPLSVNTEGAEKEGDWDPDDALPLEFRKAVADRGFEGPEEPRLAPWIEAVTYALADEIIFTNRIQRDLMLDRIGDPGLRERARSVAVVSAHPTPPERLYQGEAPIPLPEDFVHIGYFGNFYANRGIADMLVALQEHEWRDRVRLHVFTDRPGPLMDQVAALGLGGHVEVHEQLPYVDYLVQARRFDVLLVNDTAATEYIGVNPYLPSKLADYLGSGTDIWAMVEPGSPLSEVEVAFTSAVGDVEAARAVIDDIVEIHG
jgi:glycosyltransferase involved in cell wall biosynthesis